MNRPLRATSFQTLTSCAVISPRTSTSSWAGTRAGDGGEHAAELLDEGDAGTDLLGDEAAADVDGVGHELAAEGEAHRPGDGDAGLLLGLVGRGAEVRRDDDGLVLEERRLGGRLGGEDVDAGAGHATLGDGPRERGLVDDAAARGVDDAHRRLDLATAPPRR